MPANIGESMRFLSLRNVEIDVIDVSSRKKYVMMNTRDD